MAVVEEGIVRIIFGEALRNVWRRPMMWLILSASAIPLAYLNFLAVPADVQYLQFAGFAICFTLHFLFWVMAVFLFYEHDVADSKRIVKGGREKRAGLYRQSYHEMLGIVRPSVWTGLVYGVAVTFALMVAAMAIGMLLQSFVSETASESSTIILGTLYQFYLPYIAADFALVLIILSPQMLALGGARRIEEVFKSSYSLVKDRYKNSLLLLLIPEVVMRTLMMGTSFLFLLYPSFVTLYVSMIIIALLEGGRTVFLAAIFNLYYYRILDEEKKKRRKKSRQKAAKKKKR